MEIIDTHSHLFTEEFTDDLPEVILRAREAGVTRIYMPNIDTSSVADMLKVSEEYPGYCLPMIGLHPTSVNEGYQQELDKLEDLLASSTARFTAIGEVGMDLYWDKTFQQEQEDALRQQIQWAIRYDLPLVIHCREAFNELYTIMSDYRNTSLRGIFHSFTGSADEASRFLSFDGFMLGINGVLTFKKSLLPGVLTRVPIERIVIETDSPYLAPVPHRGKRNETAFIQYTLAHLASIYEKETELIADITTNNARKVFEKG